MRSVIGVLMSLRTDHRPSWIDGGPGYSGRMRQDYAPGYTPHTPEALASWIAAAAEQLRMIELWLREGHMLPVLDYELGHPVLRMTWVSPVERLHTRPLDIEDRNLPIGLQSYGRIDWITEDGGTIDTPKPYSSGFHGTWHCSLMSDHRGSWIIFIPFASTRLQHIRRSSLGTVQLNHLTFSEVASALLLR